MPAKKSLYIANSPDFKYQCHAIHSRPYQKDANAKLTTVKFLTTALLCLSAGGKIRFRNLDAQRNGSASVPPKFRKFLTFKQAKERGRPPTVRCGNLGVRSCNVQSSRIGGKSNRKRAIPAVRRGVLWLNIGRPSENSYSERLDFLQIAGRFSDWRAFAGLPDWRRAVGTVKLRPTQTAPAEFVQVHAFGSMNRHGPAGPSLRMVPLSLRSECSLYAYTVNCERVSARIWAIHARGPAWPLSPSQTACSPTESRRPSNTFANLMFIRLNHAGFPYCEKGVS